MKKLFKLLSLLRLVRDLRHSMRGHSRGAGYGRHHRGYDHHYRGYDDHRGYRDDYHPLQYRRPRKLKMKHVVRDLLGGRRY